MDSRATITRIRALHMQATERLDHVSMDRTSPASSETSEAVAAEYRAVADHQACGSSKTCAGVSPAPDISWPVTSWHY